MLSETRPAKVGQWTEPALRVLRERYLLRKDGEVIETPEEMCWRVAVHRRRRWRTDESPRRPGGAEALRHMVTFTSSLTQLATLMNAARGRPAVFGF